jgi:hypothetical protein
MTTPATIPTDAAVLEVYLAWTYAAAYRPVLATRTAAGEE